MNVEGIANSYNINQFDLNTNIDQNNLNTNQLNPPAINPVSDLYENNNQILLSPMPTGDNITNVQNTSLNNFNTTNVINSQPVQQDFDSIIKNYFMEYKKIGLII